MSKQKYPQSTSVSTSTGTTVSRGGKRKENGYSSFFIHAKRDRKRKEAEARQAAYDKLTIAEKFNTLIEGGSKKQRAKLNEQLAKAAAKGIPAKQPATETKPAKKAKKTQKA